MQHLVEIIKNPASSIAAISGVNVGKEDKARLAKDKKISLEDCYNIVLNHECNYFNAYHAVLLKPRAKVSLEDMAAVVDIGLELSRTSQDKLYAQVLIFTFEMLELLY